MAKPTGWAWMLLGSLLVAGAGGQMSLPLQGQLPYNRSVNYGPWNATASGKFAVNITALLDRAYNIDVKESSYGAIWWVVLAWQDPEAAPAIANCTAKALSGQYTCSRPCDSNGLLSAGCCGWLWLPQVHMPNLLYLEQGYIPTYRIAVDVTSGSNRVPNRVTWSTRMVGKWFSPFDFRAYPYDHQHLTVELELAEMMSPFAALVWEHTAKLNNTAHTKGEDLAGWKVVKVEGKAYDSRTCMTHYNVTGVWYSDPAPAEPELATTNPVPLSSRVLPYKPATAVNTYPDSCGSYHKVYEEARALYGPYMLVANVMVHRTSTYYIMANLVPTFFLALLVLFVFAMPPDNLSDRIMVVVTMFLSLTAMQFLFDFPPSGYLNALQQVVLVAYILAILVALETLVVHRLSTASATRGARGAGQLVNALGRGMSKAILTVRNSRMLPSADGTGLSSTTAGKLPKQSSQHKISAAQPVAAQPLQPQGPPLPAPYTPHEVRAAQQQPDAQPLQQEEEEEDEEEDVHSPTGEAPERSSSPAMSATVMLTGKDNGPRSQSGSGSVPPPDAAATPFQQGAGGKGQAAAATTDVNAPNPFATYAAQRQQRANTLRSSGGVKPKAQAKPKRRWFMALLHGVVTVLTVPWWLTRRCREDETYARRLCVSIDRWSCWVLFVLFIVTTSVLLWVQSQVGDHKLMLGGRPGNM